jgi:hypothetical protein
MKKILTLFLLLSTIKSFSQTDRNGNPIFNSVSTGEETIKDFKLHANYYTIKNNIENKNSSVYISNNPTLDQILNFATFLPSDFFLITKGNGMVNMVIIINSPSRKYIVINPMTGKQSQFDCSIIGDITENRATEILREKYDTKARMEGSTLYFNGKNLKVISNQEIKNNILELIDKQKLSGEALNIQLLSKEELRKIVLSESKEGGKFDFFTAIKGKEMDGVQLKPGLFTTNIGVALYKWGKANFELGTNTVEDALEFWAEFKGRQPNQREKEYIKLGFDKKLEK